MSELEQRRQLVRAWLGRANQDIQAAEVLNQYQTSFPDVILFHCQQAADKALKGYLQWSDLRPPKTHDLILLLGLCIDVLPIFEELAEPCKALTAFGVDPRYPLEGPDGASLSPDEAIRHASHVLDRVVGTLPPEVSAD